MNARITFPTLALAAATLLGAASVAPAAILDSSLFNHQYNGDAVPLPNYTQNSSFTTAPSSDGNIMTYRAPTSGGYWQANDWSVVSATGFSIEFRIKIGTEAGEGARGTFALYFGTGSAGDIVSIGQNKVMVGNGALTPNTSSNTDDYHIFRITQEEDGGGPVNPTIKVYRDGELIQTLPNGGNYATNVLYMGSGGSVFGGPTVQMDYIRWDNTGAYEPIPEPASLGLIALGGLLAMRRRA